MSEKPTESLVLRVARIMAAQSGSALAFRDGAERDALIAQVRRVLAAAKTAVLAEIDDAPAAASGGFTWNEINDVARAAAGMPPTGIPLTDMSPESRSMLANTLATMAYALRHGANVKRGGLYTTGQLHVAGDIELEPLNPSTRD